jgi:hypothetical protein
MSRVFRKTALGIATFTKQNSGLTQAQRGLLIMVDGKRAASQLRKFSASFGDVNVLLRELFDAGLIELDPAYVAHVQQAQADVAKEAGHMGSLAAETIMNVPRPVPTALKQNTKRDLRDFASLGEPDPTPTQMRRAMELSLAPVSGSGDDHIASASPEAIAEVKRFATRYIFDTLGTSGTPLCFAIERADGLKALLEVFEVAADTLSSMKSAKHAGEFRKQFREILLG